MVTLVWRGVPPSPPPPPMVYGHSNTPLGGGHLPARHRLRGIRGVGLVPEGVLRDPEQQRVVQVPRHMGPRLQHQPVRVERVEVGGGEEAVGPHAVVGPLREVVPSHSGAQEHAVGVEPRLVPAGGVDVEAGAGVHVGGAVPGQARPVGRVEGDLGGQCE